MTSGAPAAAGSAPAGGVCSSGCGLVSFCSMRYLPSSTRGLIGAKFPFSRAGAILFLRHEIMRITCKPHRHVHYQELPLAHRRCLFLLLRLRGEVRALLEPMPSRMAAWSSA